MYVSGSTWLNFIDFNFCFKFCLKRVFNHSYLHLAKFIGVPLNLTLNEMHSLKMEGLPVGFSHVNF